MAEAPPGGALSDTAALRCRVNGTPVDTVVETRVSLSDFLRYELGLTGTHVGCEQGACGACTVILDEEPVRSCLLLAVQVDGSEVETVESLADEGGSLNKLQAAFDRNGALQCGYCTSGFLMSLTAALRRNVIQTERDAREALSGNICRCTGYASMVRAVLELTASSSTGECCP